MKIDKKVKVSIIMPTYNVEAFLPLAIDSVLNQTFKDWELLIVDDGSTDTSNTIARQYAKQDNRIKVLNKANGGLSDARNYGLERASGEFIHFFDSDDSIVPNFYELLTEEIRNNDFIICGYFRDIEDENGSITKEIIMNCPNLSPINNNLEFKYVLSHFNYAWNKLYKKSFLNDNKLKFEKGLSTIEDKEFMSRVIQYNPKFKFVDFIGYRYKIRRRPTLGNSFSDKFINDHLRGISIENDIIDFFYGDKTKAELYKDEQTFETVQWIVHCIINKSRMTFSGKKVAITMVMENEEIMKRVKRSPNISYSNRFFKFLLTSKNISILIVVYTLIRIFKR